jgi:hypothetical protein
MFYFLFFYFSQTEEEIIINPNDPLDVLNAVFHNSFDKTTLHAILEYRQFDLELTIQDILNRLNQTGTNKEKNINK